MGDFQIIKLNSELYDFLVIATSYKNPLSDFKQVKSKIGKEHAKIIFDLTLINGVKSNRYIQCCYEYDKEIFQKCDIVKNISKNIEETSKDFFMKHEDIVQRSVIPNALKYLLVNGTI